MYKSKIQSLLDAETNHFSLDPANADWNSMEDPLKQVAADTGGFYYRTNHTLHAAFPKLFRVISGHCELFFQASGQTQKDPAYKLAVTAKHYEILVAALFNRSNFIR